MDKMTYNTLLFNYIYNFKPRFECITLKNGKTYIEGVDNRTGAEITVYHKGKEVKKHLNLKKGKVLYEVALNDYLLVNEKVMDTLWSRFYQVTRIVNDRIIVTPV